MPTLNHGPERKLALITGATGGIGKATTVAFARQGWDLALHYNAAGPETRQQLEAAIKDAAPTQPKVAFFQADLGNFDSVRKLHADVASQLGEVDILFNNAGATGGVQGPKSIAEVSVEAFEQTWRINTGSTFLLTQLCVPHMESQGWGRIVFDSSVAGFTGGSIGPHYASSKSALHGLIHWLAGNLAKKGITVNGVAPAVISGTAMMVSADDPEKEKMIAQRVPVGRLGMPEEIADTVVWMVKTGYLTNKVIAVDGGMFAQ